MVTLRQIEVSGEEALKVADALTSASMKILQLVSREPHDISTIAKKLGLSEPYISEQVRRLEELRLVEVHYERGRRGIRKLCELGVSKIIIMIKPRVSRG